MELEYPMVPVVVIGWTHAASYSITPDEQVQSLLRGIRNNLSQEEFQFFLREAKLATEAFVCVLSSALGAADVEGLHELKTLLREFALDKRAEETEAKFNEIVSDFDD